MKKYEGRKKRKMEVRAIRAFIRAVERKAADRPTYIGDFFASLECNVSHLNQMADDVLAHPGINLTPETWETMHNPYSPTFLFYYGRLMDHLTPEEEARYAEVADRIDHAWQKFLAAVPVWHPGLLEATRKIEEKRRVLHANNADLFTGEVLPKLTPERNAAFHALEDAYEPLAEGLKS